MGRESRVKSHELPANLIFLIFGSSAPEFHTFDQKRRPAESLPHNHLINDLKLQYHQTSGSRRIVKLF